MNNLAPVNTLWVGTDFGKLERACLRSFLRVGHPVRIFLYNKIDGIPGGVEIHNARDVLPESKIIRHRRGSLALFSDYFRYKLQALNAGYWVDADMYCLRPFDFAETMVVGWYSEDSCNGAVLRLPATSPLLIALLSIFEECRLAPWVPFRERVGFIIDNSQAARFRLRRRIRAALQPRFSRRDLTTNLSWGAAGPKAITHHVNALGLGDKVLAREVFYPVHYKDAAWISDPTKPLESMVSTETCAVHLWNYLLGDIKDKPALPGSFLDRLLQEGG